MSFYFDWTYLMHGMDAMKMERDGAEKSSKQEFQFLLYTRAGESSRQNVYKKTNQTAIQPYLSLHVEKYIIQIALLSFLQLQPPRTKPSQAQVKS